MVKCKHHGVKSKTRYKSTKRKRERGFTPITAMLREFKLGDVVHVRFNPGVYSGTPFRRFLGKTGVVTGRQGACYLVKIRDQEAEKHVIVHPAHLISDKSVGKG